MMGKLPASPLGNGSFSGFIKHMGVNLVGFMPALLASCVMLGHDACHDLTLIENVNMLTWSLLDFKACMEQ